MSLSVVINTKNSEKTLEASLRSVQWADEIIVVDMQSQDRTVEIARKYTSTIFSHPDVGYVEPARNFAMSKAKKDWILILDADEEVPSALTKFIQNIIQGSVDEHLLGDCFYLPRKNMVFTHWANSAGWWPDFQLRLFRNGFVEWSDEIHSIPITTGTSREIPAKEELAIIHHNYQSISQFIERMNRYTTIQAKQRPSQKVKTWSLIEKFSDEFLRRMFDWKGVDGGTLGVSLAFLQTFSEMTVVLKQWEAQQFSQKRVNRKKVLDQLQQFQSDLLYWICVERENQSTGLMRLFWKMRKKLRM